MSGTQIGTVVGGIVGAYFGGPAGAQLGMAIGGAIGGAVDPTKINGPHIGDGQTQTATDGAPIAWVMGTATIAGTIVQVGKRYEVKIHDSGKGGPVVSHYEARQDFAIVVCESSEIRNSTISSVIMVEQDGKIVYDVRPGSTMLSDSAKWKANVDFLFGAESQLPHPTLEAMTGIGTTPAYRGVCLAVFKAFNLSNAGDRIPSFRFTVSSSSALVQAGAGYRYTTVPHADAADFSIPSFDDSSWHVGIAPFGFSGDTYNAAKSFDDAFSPSIRTEWVDSTHNDLWLRVHVSLDSVPDGGMDLRFFMDDTFDMYVNGTLSYKFPGVSGGHGATKHVSSDNLVVGDNIFAFRCANGDDNDYSYFDMRIVGNAFASHASPIALSEIITRICERGGLTPSQIDVEDMSTTLVQGYPIARQMSAADALGPLLQAYFAYASEYDGKIHFKFYGADAQITIDDDDLIVGSDANNGNVTETKRNQETEFPRKITASYLDPAQNYTVVQVSDQRTSADVIAIGEQTLQIPVAMDADTAKQAVNKAMKVAWATLQGTRDYSVPFARTADYLTICVGEPVLMAGKRWVVDELTMGDGALTLKTRYDRQSAYTSNVQAIVGLAPTAPTSRYSGPTTLIPMNLPSLRPQDTYGLYIAAASATGSPSWKGCTVQVSYDGQITWVNAVTIVIGSTLGTVVGAEPSGGEPLTVDVDGDLETVTDAQITAQANAFALVDGDTAEIGQFQTASLNTDGTYDLTDIDRGLLGTTEVPATANQTFTMLANVYFLPIDISFSGKVIALRAVGFGEIAEDSTVVTIAYNPDTTIIYDGGEIT